MSYILNNLLIFWPVAGNHELSFWLFEAHMGRYFRTVPDHRKHNRCAALSARGHTRPHPNVANCHIRGKIWHRRDMRHTRRFEVQ